jgi:ribosomal protein L37E
MKSIEELERQYAEDPNKHRKIYLKRAKAGKCVGCGKVDVLPPARRCDTCKVRYPGGGTPVTFKQWRDRKVAEGFCSRCGRRPHAENRKLCAECLVSALASTNKRMEKFPLEGKQRKRALKLETLNAYGGPKCWCCGFAEDIVFLTLAHGRNDGAAHRRSIFGNKQAAGGGEHMYYWLKKRGFPQDLGLRVECWNCNCEASKNGGICPHQEKELHEEAHA